MTRVLLIGGAGVFGRHLAEGLVRDGFPVVIAGRNLDRAQAVADRLAAAHPGAQVSALSLDTATLTPANLRTALVDIVADVAGPFQGAEPLVARAAIAAGLHYVDLADARAFIADFPALDAAARAAGVEIFRARRSASSAVIGGFTAFRSRRSQPSFDARALILRSQHPYSAAMLFAVAPARYRASISAHSSGVWLEYGRRCRGVSVMPRSLRVTQRGRVECP